MTPLTIQEIKTTNGSSEITKLLKQWVDIVDRYSTRHKPTPPKPNGVDKPNGDACWWHTERASIGVLAGAAWSLGWTALEEYSTNKNPENSEKNQPKKDIKRGRCDLQIATPKKTYSFEAKQISVSIGGRAKATHSRVEVAMSKAFKDAKELPKDEASERHAITFIVPYISRSDLDLKSEGDDSIASAIEDIFCNYLSELPSLIKAPEYSLGAVFPASSRTLIGPNGNRYYPGVIAVIRPVIRGNSFAKTDD